MSAATFNVKEIYEKDLVYKFDQQGGVTLGFVCVTYDDDFSLLQKGQIQVSFINSPKKQICHQSEVHLMSRSIFPGDLVQRFEEGKETQRGYCKELKQFATVQIVESDKVIEHIPESRLCFVKPFNVEDAVSLGNKFGRIKSIDRVVRMQSQCGSVVEVRSSVNHNIRDYWSESRHGFWADRGHRYPGQTVICTPDRFTDPNWLNLSPSMRRNMTIDQTFTIQSIHICSIKVSWYISEDEVKYTEFKEDEIKRLKVVPYTGLALCDRLWLKLEQTDILLEKSEWLKKIALQHLPDQVPVVDNSILMDTEDDDEESDDNRDITVAVEVLSIDARATVVWQDGTEENDIPTTQLHHPVSLDEHEFFPGEWVFCNTDFDRCGVVQKVNFLERTAEIKWFTYSDSDRQPQELITTNEISVYDLEVNNDNVFRPGEVVKAKPTENDKIGKVIDSSVKGYVIVEWSDGTKENCWPHDIEVIPEREYFDFADDSDTANYLQEDPDSWDRDTIELIEDDATDEIDLQSVATNIDWMRTRIFLLGTVMKHTHTKMVFPITDFLGVYLNCSYLDKYLGTSLFGPESKHLQLLLQEVKKVDQPFRDLMESLVSAMTNREKETIQWIINLNSKFMAQIESNNENSGDLLITDSAEQSEEWQHNCSVELLGLFETFLDMARAEIKNRIDGRQATNTSENTIDPSPSTSNPQNTLATPGDLTPTPLECTKSTEVAPKIGSFCIIGEAPDTHLYFSSEFKPKDQQKFLSAVQKEYKLLEESLPAGIWVKTYDNRMDLLSVMIEGPKNTPYEDGLFFFDIQLSPDYPQSPPSVFYISYISEKLNPNLYVEGRVCLSLLGTWRGRQGEGWGPNSTLLQLIVSIQGLILVAEPYYNEAGFEGQTHTQQGNENSRTYNEFVILKLVESTTVLLHSMPKDFQSEILAHFKANGEKMYERLMKYCEDEQLKPEFPLLPVSKGVKLSLGSALQRFKRALENAGKEAVL